MVFSKNYVKLVLTDYLKSQNHILSNVIQGIQFTW